MTDLIPPTIDDQIACVEREIALRRRVYPRWIANKRMTERTARYEIDVMTEVLNTLKEVKRG